jgi:hypothetical protein
MLPGVAAGTGVEAACAGPATLPATTSPATAQRACRPRVDPQDQRTGYATEWVIVAE